MSDVPISRVEPGRYRVGTAPRTVTVLRCPWGRPRPVWIASADWDRRIHSAAYRASMADALDDARTFITAAHTGEQE